MFKVNFKITGKDLLVSFCPSLALQQNSPRNIFGKKKKKTEIVNILCKKLHLVSIK